MKKILITLIAVCTILLTVGIINVSAKTIDSENNLTWTFDEGTLIIDGNGSMTNYNSIISTSQPPWYEIQDSIVKIIINDGVTSIGDYAFWGCNSLASITIPDSVTSIGASAFAYCRSLVSITIPDGVTSIGRSTFYGCSSLVSIAIPDSVTSISGSAFQDCASLTSITIPDSVTNIDTMAFYSCNSLVSITIPDSVTNIGDDAFMYCSSLENIIVNEDNPSYSSIDGVLFDKSKTILITYPSSKTDGGYTIPDSVTSIGNYAFLECDNLKCICLHQGIKDIEYSAFYGCSNITTVFYAGSETQWNEISFYSSNENLTNAKIIYNATKKIYKFETNCDKALDDITDYAIFTMPTVQNDGMTLNGWYDNVALSGIPVTFPYYGDATMLYAAWMDGTGKSFDDAFIAKANQEYTATTTESGQLVYFEFVPNFSKEYRFYTTGNLDTYGYLYNSDKSQLTSDNDDGDGNNFYISYNLTAGETYYIATKLYSGTGTFTFVVEEPVDYRINEITIKDMSGNSLQAIPTGTFLATVSFTNVSSSADTVIILAQYTDAGAFKGLMYVQTEDVPTGSTIKLSIPVDNSKGDVAKLKAFCWESFGSLTPMGNSVSFPAE